jgi:hypothetical protein
MAFRCPLCNSTGFEPVTVRRPNGTLYRSDSLYSCNGCSAAFTDPTRFTRPPSSGAQESLELRGWQSRRTLARRARAER